MGFIYAPPVPQVGGELFINSNYDVRQRGSTGTHTTTLNIDTSFLFDRMFTLPVGASVTSAVDSTAAHLGSRAAQGQSIIGLASVTTVDHGQIISSAKQTRYKQPLCVTATIWNHTGAAFVPLLRFDTPGTAETNAGRTFTNRSSQSLQSCASAAVTTVSAVVDPSAFTNIGNGLMVYLRIPSGSLDVNTKDITISQFSVRPANRVLLYVPPDSDDELWRCMAYFFKTFPQGTAPAQSAGTTTGVLGYTVQIASTTAGWTYFWRFPRPMVKAPTITTFNPSAANTKWRNVGAAADSGTPVVNLTANDCGVDINNPQVAGDSVSNYVVLHATANAELS